MIALFLSPNLHKNGTNSAMNLGAKRKKTKESTLFSPLNLESYYSKYGSNILGFLTLLFIHEFDQN